MRITKKFAGSHGIGKHVFAPADMKVVNEEEMMEVLVRSLVIANTQLKLMSTYW